MSDSVWIPCSERLPEVRRSTESVIFYFNALTSDEVLIAGWFGVTLAKLSGEEGHLEWYPSQADLVLYSNEEVDYWTPIPPWPNSKEED